MRRAVLAVAGAAVLWSSGGLFIKLAPMPALAVACGRSLIAGVFYLLVLRPNLRAARWTTAAAYAACIVTFVSATKLTTAANAIFLQYTGPAYVLLLSPFLLAEPFRPIDAVCVALALAGMSLFFVGKVEPGQAIGNVVAIASGVFFALAIVLLRRDAKGGSGDALPSTTLGNLLAVPRIGDHAVLDSVQLVALRQRGRLDHRQLGRGNRAVIENRLLVEDEPGEVVAPEVRGSGNDDTVEVLGEALRLHQRLAAAVRAADEV